MTKTNTARAAAVTAAKAPAKPATIRKAGTVATVRKPTKPKPAASAEQQAIAPAAFSEGKSRADLVAAINAYLSKGGRCTPDKLEVARTEFMAGRIAARLDAVHFPANALTIADRISHALRIVTGQVAAKPEAVAKARNAAKSAWSLVLAETGYGQATTLKDKNAKQASRTTGARGKVDQSAKAAPAGAPTGNAQAKADASTAKGSAALADALQGAASAPAAPKVDKSDKTAVIAFMTQQAASLQMFANSASKVLPVDIGMAVIALHKACAAWSAKA